MWKLPEVSAIINHSPVLPNTVIMQNSAQNISVTFHGFSVWLGFGVWFFLVFGVFFLGGGGVGGVCGVFLVGWVLGLFFIFNSGLILDFQITSTAKCIL